MKKRKYLFVLMSTILSTGLLFGCNGDGVDENEPDPTEEPSEQREQDEQQNDNNNK
ncbi:hypothetical protein QUF88_15700 [Bacillus sp. DX1.1]|uniref:hypothetical protein n=1 Tax=unclassified Bacillus (in: firmicutes) TaxID=185979 RepID=UPI00256FFC13|nr:MULTISPECIES: hypothetical protein [unclassified Bacillus (in: firmicutes)]MDM5155199.1 hypothetical protein [Bacillus sp. DX1.1]WJE79520.1 hypothetical protein QRE67_13195 [Bacillus sp. DX3.1]